MDAYNASALAQIAQVRLVPSRPVVLFAMPLFTGDVASSCAFQSHFFSGRASNRILRDTLPPVFSPSRCIACLSRRRDSIRLGDSMRDTDRTVNESCV